MERVRNSLTDDSERKLNDIAQDMANKENNRRMIIKGIKESCQHEVEG